MKKKILLFFILYSIDAFSLCKIDMKRIEDKSTEDIQTYIVELKVNKCLDVARRELEKVDLEKNKSLSFFSGLLHLMSCEGPCSIDIDEKAKMQIHKACDKGLMDACYMRALNREEKRKEGLLKVAKEFCDKNSSDACHSLALELHRLKKKTWRLYMKKSCDLKMTSSCELLKVGSWMFAGSEKFD